MKATKTQLKQIDDFLKLSEQIEALVPQVGALDSATLGRVERVKEEAKKAKRIKNKANIADQEAKAKKGASVDDLVKMYNALLKQKTSAGMDALEGILDKVDNAIVGKAEEFLASAQNFIDIAKSLPILPEPLKAKLAEVEGWVAKGKGILDKLKQYKDLLIQYANIAKNFLDGGIDLAASAVQQGSALANTVVVKAGALTAEIKGFIEAAKKIGGGAFADKIKSAEDMLSKADSVLNKVVGLLNILPDDQNINNIHAWYDKIVKAWTTMGGTGLLSFTKLDDKIIAQIGALLATSEKWMAEAQKIKGTILEKVVYMQQLIADLKKVMTWVQSAGDFLKDVKNGDTTAIFNKLKGLWDGIDKTTDIFSGMEWDDKLLAKVKEMKGKADNFAKLALSFLGKFGLDDAKKVDEWAKQALDIVVRMSQGEDVIGQYIDLARKWAENKFQEVADGTKKATEAIMGQATSFANEVKQFIAGASAIKGDTISEKIQATSKWLKTSEGIFNKIEEVIGLVVGDKDENGLPDWYDQLDKYFQKNIAGKDFLQGVNFDDVIVAKLSGFKKSADEFLAKAVKSSQDLIEKINNVRQWVETIGKALEFGAGIVKKFENKDWLGLYDEAVNIWKGIGNLDDLLKGTKVDNKLIDKLKEAKDKAETWILNKLTDAVGGDVNQAKEIITLADRAIRFLLTRHEVEDFSKEFKEDRIIITEPPLERMTPEEEELAFKKLSGGSSAPLKDQLGIVLRRINDMMVELAAKVDDAYRKTMENGYKAADTYKAAKKSYDQAMAIQKETVGLIESLLKVAATVLITVVAPAAGVSPAIIEGIKFAAKVFQSVDSGDYSKAAEQVMEKVGGMDSIGGMLAVALPMALPNKLKQNVEFDMEAMFRKGVTSKYEYVKGFIGKIQEKLSELYDQLGTMSAKEDDIKQLKTTLMMLYKQWMSVKKQIEDKYINTNRDRINENLALHNFSAALYANWMVNRQPRTVRGEDPLIVKEVIKEMRKWRAGGGMTIMDGVKWDEDSVGGKVSRFFGWLLGDWCTPGHKEAVKKMKANGQKALGVLASDAAWRVSFA